jgi:hypothetical protein
MSSILLFTSLPQHDSVNSKERGNFLSPSFWGRCDRGLVAHAGDDD